MSSGEIIMTVFTVFGGLALFVFGMNCLTDGLKRSAGDSLRRIPARATRSRPNGLETLLDTLVQSSTDEYTEQKILHKLDAGEYLDNQ
jgi:Na+/phosphate symporter